MLIIVIKYKVTDKVFFPGSQFFIPALNPGPLGAGRECPHRAAGEESEGETCRSVPAAAPSLQPLNQDFLLCRQDSVSLRPGVPGYTGTSRAVRKQGDSEESLRVCLVVFGAHLRTAARSDRDAAGGTGPRAVGLARSSCWSSLRTWHGAESSGASPPSSVGALLCPAPHSTPFSEEEPAAQNKTLVRGGIVREGRNRDLSPEGLGPEPYPMRLPHP